MPVDISKKKQEQEQQTTLIALGVVTLATRLPADMCADREKKAKPMLLTRRCRRQRQINAR